MRKNFLILSLTLLAFGCSNDDTSEDGIEVQVFTRENCSNLALDVQSNVTIQMYSTQDLFDYTDRILVETLNGLLNGELQAEIEDGSYYFEVFNEAGSQLLKGIYRMPEDLADDGNIKLIKGVKQGVVKHENINGNNIADAEIIYTEEITGEEFVTFSDGQGKFCVELNPGRYHVRVNHPDYESFDTEEGFSVFWSGSEGFSNFFLQ